MIRLFVFLLGLAMLVIGAANNIESVPNIIDVKSIELGISTSVMTLDVLFIVVGVILILGAWVIHRLAQ